MVQAKSETVRLYIVEEQDIYREIYKYTLPLQANIELLRVSANGGAGTLVQSAMELCPDVLLLSVKKLDLEIIEELEQIRNELPKFAGLSRYHPSQVACEHR